MNEELLLIMQPYGFDIGASAYGIVLKGLDYGVEGMRVGGQVPKLTFSISFVLCSSIHNLSSIYCGLLLPCM